MHHNHVWGARRLARLTSDTLVLIFTLHQVGLHLLHPHRRVLVRHSGRGIRELSSERTRRLAPLRVEVNISNGWTAAL